MFLIDFDRYFILLLAINCITALIKFPLNTWTKIFLAGAFFACAITGFLVKLPPGFRHFDKELHSLFYFIAAAFLNVLFAKRNIFIHALIFAGLYVFGIVIEFAQAYSNKFFQVRIHGRYDPEDVRANLKGLIIFSVVWIVYVAFFYLYKTMTGSKLQPKGE